MRYFEELFPREAYVDKCSQKIGNIFRKTLLTESRLNVLELHPSFLCKKLWLFQITWIVQPSQKKGFMIFPGFPIVFSWPIQ